MKDNVFTKVGLNCIGCGLCENLCPKSCISIREKSNVGIVPFVDDINCINCGVCVEVCPTDVITEREKLSAAKAVYTGRSKNQEIVKRSSSGGIVSSIIIDLFDKGKIDAAVVAFFDERLNIYGDVITSKDEVINHSGSFYHTARMLKNIDKIKNYKSVVFVGLPCHNASLKKFQEKYNVKNIYATISLFCTIGRMKKGFDELLNEHSFLIDAENGVIEYRSRYGEKRLGDVYIKIRNGRELTFPATKILDKDYFYCPHGCLNCRKLFGVEFSDISVGDNWGVKTEEKIAIITANSQNGLRIIEENKLIHITHSSVDELIKSQPLGYPLKYGNRKWVNVETWGIRNRT